ncbi:hypothetical protein SAMN05216390_11473 [Lachnospiraceae bacterium KH1T2]|jgi:hypothetical protein|nr:hypothetical protein SAMN05216390_11473 [Lachnospiraceae bacterium KH1T2]
MAALKVIGSILRFILRIVLLPVQALLTILQLAFGFASGVIMIIFILLGGLFCFGGVISLITNPEDVVFAIEAIIIGALIFAVPMAIKTWGTGAIMIVKELLAKI